MKQEKFYDEPAIEIIGLMAEQVFAASEETDENGENLYLEIESW